MKAMPLGNESTILTLNKYLECLDEWTDWICRRTDELLQAQGSRQNPQVPFSNEKREKQIA
jgi:hypothetical protein